MIMEAEAPKSEQSSRLREVGTQFLRLGLVAFGGPAAHIGMMRDEFVRRRKWLDDQSFLDYIGATNLIPGPNSTEMAIHLGYLRAGWRGLILAGVSFITPAFLLVLLFAWAYVEYGTTPQGEWILWGVKPVVVGVIGFALWTLGKKAVKGPLTAIVGILATAIYFFLGWSEIALILLGGVTVSVIINGRRLLEERGYLASFGIPLLAQVAGEQREKLLDLFLNFLKIGAVLYGSGYVLFAFLYGDFVETGILSEQQLVDAVAIGQVTPGPVFTTATFIGYLLAGVPGAIVATIGIFLPSFIFVAITNPLIPKMRASPWLGGFLDGVNVSALALMAVVSVRLGIAAIVDIPSAVMAVVAAVLLIRFKVSATWLVLGGAAIGLLRFYLLG
jgi:chromate transporter